MRRLVEVAGQKNGAARTERGRHVVHKCRSATASRGVGRGDCLGLRCNQPIADVVRLIWVRSEVNVEDISFLGGRDLQPDALIDDLSDGIAANDGNVAVETL